MKKKLLIVALVLFALAANAQETKRVLFIGNSYTDVNNLPLLVQRVSESAGNMIEYQSNTPGGCTFQQHCSNQSMTLIRQGGWDVVVLQEQSQLPSFPQNQVENECLPYAAQLVDAVYHYNPDGEAMFYMTWGRKFGDQPNARFFPVLGTYEGMDSMLYERYMYMARANDASVCPVGRVWRYLRNNHADIELYERDESHPSLCGSYAAACAFYTMIFHRSPRDITYTPEIDDMAASNIRQAVETVVYDNLSFWLRQQQDTTQTDTTQTDTTQTDTTHIDTTHIDTTQVGLRLAEAPAFAFYPNPATSSLTVVTLPQQTSCEAVISDHLGRKLRSVKLLPGDNSLGIADLPRGAYILTIVSPEGLSSAKFIKE